MSTTHGVAGATMNSPGLSSLGRSRQYNPDHDGQAIAATGTHNYASSGTAGYVNAGSAGQQINASSEFGGGGGGQFGPPQTPARTSFEAHEQQQQSQAQTIPQQQSQAPSMQAASVREDPAIRETRQKLAQFVDMLSNGYKLSAVHRRELHQYAQARRFSLGMALHKCSSYARCLSVS